MKKKRKVEMDGVTEELADMMLTMKVDSWEMRKNSKGDVRLYIRCMPIVPPVRMVVR